METVVSLPTALSNESENHIFRQRDISMHFGFSYVGLIFLVMLIIPNLFWTRNKPKSFERPGLLINCKGWLV